MKFGKSLIIFEYVDDILVFAKKRSLDMLRDKDVNILAIHPDAQAYLKSRNISFFNTLEFFTKESHQELIVKSAEIIELLREVLKLEDDLGVMEGYNNAFIFYLRQDLYTLCFMAD